MPVEGLPAGAQIQLPDAVEQAGGASSRINFLTDALGVTADSSSAAKCKRRGSGPKAKTKHIFEEV
jgi:hypothetical protein